MSCTIEPSATTRPTGGWRPSRRARVAGVALCAALAVACGKKGPPLAPLRRVPAKVSAWSASRAGDAVFLTLTVPVANVGGDQPADIAGVEIYAVTSASAPPPVVDGRVPEGLGPVVSLPVRRPLPPPPASAPGQPQLPELPREPGLDQGAVVTVREALTPATTAPVPGVVPEPAAPPEPEADDDAPPALSLPLVYAPTTSAARRHYVAVAVSRRGRRGAWSDWKSVPLGPTSGAPGAPVLTYDEQAIAVTWTPAPDARQAPAAALEGALESRPFGPAQPATRYNVYDAAAAGVAADVVPGQATRPTPLNDAPLAVPLFTLPGVTFGVERCLVVRPLDTVAGVEVEGPASAPGCATPRDTFPPPAPTALAAVAGAGVIGLIWDAAEVPDLGGYLVLRGVAPGEPTTPLTPEPIAATSFEDRSVTPGVRYVYVVVAVDSATPVNRSAPSNRAEETARQ